MNLLKRTIEKASLLLATFFYSFASFAQDKKIDVNIGIDKGNNWYAQPWVWVVGAAVFILLLVAILKSNNSKS